MGRNRVRNRRSVSSGLQLPGFRPWARPDLGTARFYGVIVTSHSSVFGLVVLERRTHN